jgi:hypothetical protein
MTKVRSFLANFFVNYLAEDTVIGNLSGEAIIFGTTI